MILYRILPSIFTIGNLSLGIIAIVLTFKGELEYAAIMVIISMILDGADGTIARLFNTQSNFGKELDSLSDLISFGLAPSLIMYVVILQDYGVLGWLLVILFPVAGAIRLAQYNVKPGIPGYFVGLPITAAGGILATLSLYYEIFHPIILILITTFLSYLMLSKIKYPNFKKAELPKMLYWIAPLIILLTVILALLFPNQFSKVVFLPLGLYALYGIINRFRRYKANNSNKENTDSNESEDL